MVKWLLSLLRTISRRSEVKYRNDIPYGHILAADPLARHCKIKRAYRVELLRKNREKGTWVIHDNGTRRPEVYIVCPFCAGIMNASDHEISKDGIVHPCVVCGQCQSHIFMKLEGWKYGARKAIYRGKEIGR